jgi:hypothetical protein
MSPAADAWPEGHRRSFQRQPSPPRCLYCARRLKRSTEAPRFEVLRCERHGCNRQFAALFEASGRELILCEVQSHEVRSVQAGEESWESLVYRLRLAEHEIALREYVRFLEALPPVGSCE